MAMTPAEFKTIRQSLNLSQRDVARAIGKDDRYIRYWEAGTYAIPPDVAEWLLGRDAEVEAELAKRLYLFNEGRRQRKAVGFSERTYHLTFRKEDNSAIMARLRQMLMREGVKVEIRYSEEGE